MTAIRDLERFAESADRLRPRRVQVADTLTEAGLCDCCGPHECDNVGSKPRRGAKTPRHKTTHRR